MRVQVYDAKSDADGLIFCRPKLVGECIAVAIAKAIERKWGRGGFLGGQERNTTSMGEGGVVGSCFNVEDGGVVLGPLGVGRCPLERQCFR